MKVNDVGYPVIALGKGLVVVGEGHLDKLPAIVLSLNGSGVIGTPITNPGYVPPEVTLAVITFGNIECLDVFISVANRLRDKMVTESTFVVPPINQI